MFGMNIRKAIKKHIDKHGSDNTVVLVMSYNDELLLAARTVIQKIAPVKVELLTFPQFYNELDTQKMIKQINEAKPTLIINVADKKWMEEVCNILSHDIETMHCREYAVRLFTFRLKYGQLDKNTL